MSRNLSPDWNDWIDDNLRKKNDKFTMMEILLELIHQMFQKFNMVLPEV